MGVDRRAVLVSALLFGVGVVVGLILWVTDATKTSTHAGVAVANSVHVAIAALLVAVVVSVRRRSPAALRSFLALPVSRRMWDATTGAVRFVRVRRAVAGEPRHRSRLGAAVTSLPPSLLAFAVLVLVAFVLVRSGVQVFAALDPDFTRDAWGGPSYLGASLAHWMDGALLLYGGVALLTWLSPPPDDAAARAGTRSRACSPPSERVPAE